MQTESLDTQVPAPQVATPPQPQPSAGGEGDRTLDGPARSEPQFKIPPQGTGSKSSAPQQVREVGKAPRRPWIALARQIYRAADAALDLVNRPFFWLTGQARNVVGWWALATIAVALSSWLLLPPLLPNRDAVAFLREKRSAIDKPAGAGAALSEADPKH